MSTIYEKPDIYDLIENDARSGIIRSHWEKLLSGKKVRSFLDVSIGTGNLTLPLCDIGIELYGSDLSTAMLEKCRGKGFPVDLRQCDFRKLTDSFSMQFDCVGSTGNSLPHVENSEVLATLEQMDKLIKPGGYLYFDMRNWDKILNTRQRFYLYPPFFSGDMRINLVQVWDYNDDDSITFNLLYSFEKDGRLIGKEQFEEHYFPISSNVLTDKLREMGYTDIEIMCHPAQFTNIAPENADWYCVMAHKAT